MVMKNNSIKLIFVSLLLFRAVTITDVFGQEGISSNDVTAVQSTDNQQKNVSSQVSKKTEQQPTQSNVVLPSEKQSKPKNPQQKEKEPIPAAFTDGNSQENTLIEQEQPVGQSLSEEELTLKIKQVIDANAGELDVPFVIAIVALAISLYALFKLSSNRKKTSGIKENNVTNNHNRRSETIEEKIINYRNENVNLQNQINSLINQLSALENLVNRLEQSQMTRQHVSVQRNNLGESPTNSSQKKYATAVTGNGFAAAVLTDNNSDFVIAVLTITGNQGTYVINDLPSSQTYLIQNFSYTAGMICNTNSKVSTPRQIQTVTPGRIQKDGEGWKIIEKALVNLL